MESSRGIGDLQIDTYIAIIANPEPALNLIGVVFPEFGVFRGQRKRRIS
jgi:hypothetical protein